MPYENLAAAQLEGLIERVVRPQDAVNSGGPPPDTPNAWRARRIAAILDQCAQHGWRRRLAAMLGAHYGAAALDELADPELQEIYRIVSVWSLKADLKARKSSNARRSILQPK